MKQSVDLIDQLDAHMEELRASITRSKNFLLCGQATTAVGIMVVVGLATGLLMITPLRTLAAVALSLGGLVKIGSSKRTTDDLRAALDLAETARLMANDGLPMRMVRDQD